MNGPPAIKLYLKLHIHFLFSWNQKEEEGLQAPPTCKSLLEA